MTDATNLEHLWMPFTANRQFKADPRMLVSADGCYYTNQHGDKILDGSAGLWCVNAGHNRKPIVEAVQKQVAMLDYAPPFQMGHPFEFEAATKLVEFAPEGLNRVFFCNSGSEAVETALKIALAYHRVRGDAGRQRLIGRERGYHGVNFGGISVGGMAGNRKHFGNGLAGVDHLRHPLDIQRNAFSRGLPAFGAEIADELEQHLLTTLDPSTVAAVIVEPMQGSAGVIMPPKGYLKKLRDITRKYGILLIFDEVITGFGRMGSAFAAQEFDVVPDMITCAKGITNGTVPMGAVLVRQDIHDAFMDAAAENMIELPHGYTYSGHPLACAAAVATMNLYQEERLFERATELAPYFEDAIHALKGKPYVKDIRNYGLVGAIEMEGIAGSPGKRAFNAFLKGYEKGIYMRFTGDILAFSPPLIIEKHEIDSLFGRLGDVLDHLD